MEEIKYDLVAVEDIASYIACITDGYIFIEYPNADYKELFFRLLELEQANDNIKCAVAKAYLFGQGTIEDASRAFSLLTPLAKRGHPDALYLLGYCCYYGKGTPQDYEYAVYWLKKACQVSHPQALFLFGKMYINGQGVEASIKEAIKLFIASSKMGLPEAYDALGCIYLNGTGVTVSGAKAIEYLSIAAEMGYAQAQYNLGRIYQKGLTGDLNIPKAITLYRQSGNNGYARSFYTLGLMYLNKETDIITRTEAIEYLERAAALDFAPAQFRLAKYYEQIKAYAEAAKWYSKASNNGVVDASVALGTMYAEGKGINPNFKEAIKWYEKACEKEYIKAYALIGKLYVKGGNGIQRNFFKGIEYIQKAIDINYPYGYFDLGLLYVTDEEYKDYDTAIEYLDKAKTFDIVDAYLLEARMYKSEKYFEYNPQECISNYERAIELGAPTARKELDEFKNYLKSCKVCQYCGGQFKGLITKFCVDCGRPKDY